MQFLCKEQKYGIDNRCTKGQKDVIITQNNTTEKKSALWNNNNHISAIDGDLSKGKILDLAKTNKVLEKRKIGITFYT